MTIDQQYSQNALPQEAECTYCVCLSAFKAVLTHGLWTICLRLYCTDFLLRSWQVKIRPHNVWVLTSSCVCTCVPLFLCVYRVCRALVCIHVRCRVWARSQVPGVLRVQAEVCVCLCVCWGSVGTPECHLFSVMWPRTDTVTHWTGGT